jgi:cardiolipin synthase
MPQRPASAKSPPYENIFPTIPGNSVRLLAEGAQYFPALFAAAETAKESLLVESYIFGDDAVGRRMLEIMTARARAGVAVRLIIDGFGSEDFPPEKLAPLQAAGGGVYIHKPVNLWSKGWALLKRLLFMSHRFSNRDSRGRDHRKMVVVDGSRVFLGGINLTAGEQSWRDFMLDIEGPAAAQAARLFAGLWNRKNPPLNSPRFFPEPRAAGDLAVRILGHQTRRIRQAIFAAYREGINAARREVIIANAYFLPDHRLRRLLYRAVENGVTVTLLLPQKSDVAVAQAASEYFYHRLLRKGIAIHLFDAAVLHAKVAVVDGRWLTVGSYNLDHQSLFDNLEVTAVIEDEALGGKLRALLATDLARSPALDLASWNRRPWRSKVRSWWWHLFERLM